ncbi:hypothetical protein OIE63_02490 [Streptomyces sp. NBC_01795]|uniref:hypothetical protein n=1 Tax=unclassified Streptomyces TaxID=2593676 RepID=UPI002DDB1629|nr:MULTISPECIES: hypothetical protein [unclassified Streptomyces]WSA90529.1 hypothetical protein OIE63_02490 [Streptomyces sp. NBC_01795]WSB74854.1 hypothetical protein OHB04_03000 [Streptomyces sp. NBC_01775]WSS16863.1 hypothetical protein OG533_36920 [Streptomyces sp. NBC_01186]
MRLADGLRAGLAQAEVLDLARIDELLDGARDRQGRVLPARDRRGTDPHGPHDLPGYAGRLHDYFTDHPDRFRLMSWGQLELDAGDSLPHDTFRESVASKIEQLREAQEADQLEAPWDPVDILVLVHQIATAWAAQPDLLPRPARAAPRS